MIVVKKFFRIGFYVMFNDILEKNEKFDGVLDKKESF